MITKIKRFIRRISKKDERIKWNEEINPRVRIVKDAKDYARRISQGNELECIKATNKLLKEIYENPYFSENLDYIYTRYVDLEKREPIFSEILFPSLIAILSLDSVKNWFRNNIEEILLLQDNTYMDVIGFLYGDNLWIEKAELLRLLLVYILFLMLLLYFAYRLLISFFQLFQRNAASTILETEMSLLREILVKNGILPNS